MDGVPLDKPVSDIETPANNWREFASDVLAAFFCMNHAKARNRWSDKSLASELGELQHLAFAEKFAEEILSCRGNKPEHARRQLRIVLKPVAMPRGP